MFEGVLSPAISVEVATDAPHGSKSATASAATAAAEATAAEAAGANGHDPADITDDKPNVALRTAVEMLSVVLSGYAVSGGRAAASVAFAYDLYRGVRGNFGCVCRHTY